MKLALVLVAAVVAGTGFAPAAPVTIEYSRAHLARDGRTIAWTWTVRNTGAPVGDLTVVHRLRPRLDVVAMTPGCAATSAAVRCGYGALPAGGRRTGRLVARVPDGTRGTVRIGGTVTWRRAASGRA